MLNDFKECLQEISPNIQKYISQYTNMFDDIVHAKEDDDRDRTEIFKKGKSARELYS
jgi:hypothetical protein